MLVYAKGFFVLLFFILMNSFSAQAQQRDSLLSDLAIKWKNAQAYALDVATRMPDSAYGFKPMPEEMSFGEQLLHIADNINWLSSEYLLGGSTPKKQTTSPLSKASVLAILRAAYDTGYAVQQRLPAARLNDTVSFFAGTKTRRQIVVLLHDHQTHHIGQLIVYLRLQGIKPPDYVGW